MPFPPHAPSDECSPGALLRRFVSGDADAFRELIRRCYPLVFSAALRRSGGQHALAEDAAQVVFIDLARRAPGLRADDRLGGWLHQRAVRATRDLMRGEQRRRERESEALADTPRYSLDDDGLAAWRDLAPRIDEALNRLSRTDRDAVLLRCVEGRDFRTIGQALGLSADAAQKRVSRALEKLRGLLTRRGVVPAATALASGLLADTAAAAERTLSGNAARLAAVSLAKAGGITAFARWLPQLKAAAVVGALTAAGWAWPQLHEYATRDASPAPLSPPASVPVPAGAATIRYPGFPAPPRQEAGLSVEEIVRRIGALAAGPYSSTASSDFSFFARELGKGERSGEALRLMTRDFPTAWLQAMDEREWRNVLIVAWADTHPWPALDYAVRNLRIPQGEEYAGLVQSAVIDILRNTPDAKAVDVCTWFERTMIPSENSGRGDSRVHMLWQVTRVLLERALQQKSADALAILCRIENEQRLGIFTTCEDAARDTDSLRLLADAVPQLATARQRADLMQNVMRRFGSLDRERAEAYVEALEDPVQRLAYAALVSSPPILIPARTGIPLPQEARKSRVAWWLRMAPPGQHDTVALQIADVWNRLDPDWSEAWLEQQVPPDAFDAALIARFTARARWMARTTPEKINFPELERLAGKLRLRAPEKTAAAFAEVRRELEGRDAPETLLELLQP